MATVQVSYKDRYFMVDRTDDRRGFLIRIKRPKVVMNPYAQVRPDLDSPGFIIFQEGSGLRQLGPSDFQKSCELAFDLLLIREANLQEGIAKTEKQQAEVDRLWNIWRYGHV